jgi:hypothetical protein
VKISITFTFPVRVVWEIFACETPLVARKQSVSNREKHNCHRGEVTLERLERALAAISYAILLDGPIYAPYLERLEREIAAMRAEEDAVSRARQYLEKFRDQAAAASSGGVKAIA